MWTLLLALLQPLHAAAVSWPSLLDEQGGGAVRFGAMIGGREPFARNEAEPFAPASNAKLFTAGAALEALGPGFRYRTTLSWREAAPGVAAEVTLTGNGDPSWGVSELGETADARFDLFVAALRNAGVREVTGGVRALSLDPRWDRVRIPDGWKPSDTTGCGGALAQAFNVALNCATLTVSGPGRAAWAGGVVFPVQLAVRAGKANDLTASLVPAARGYAFRVEGTWKSGEVSFSLPVYDTHATVAARLRAALTRAGIRLTRAGAPAKGERREQDFESPPLAILLKPFLKNSVNVLGDAFLKTIGLARANPDLLAGGLEALHDYLAQNGVRTAELHDGSGLSRTSRVEPRELFAFLTSLQRSPAFPAVWAALPIAGVDGTLRNRMKGTAAENRLRAKTGTLDGVYNLAGWLPLGRDYVPFVLLTRTTSGHSADARAAEDRVGAALAGLHAEPLITRATALEAPFPYVPEHAGLDDQ